MAQLPMGTVIAGEYEGSGVATKGFIKQCPIIVNKGGADVLVTKETVDCYEIIDGGNTKKTAGRAIGGAVLFGVIGAVVGSAAAKTKTTGIRISVHWTDGKKSLLEINGEMKKVFELAVGSKIAF